MLTKLAGEAAIVTVQRRGLSVAAVCAIAAVALAVAIGIGRFALTPLLPLMVRDGSLTLGASAWLAASNYAGYLAGALTVSRLGLSSQTLMRWSVAGIVLATAAMGALEGVAAWTCLRFAAGVMSAWAFVAASAWALGHLSQAGRRDLDGLVFAGVGFGIAAVGLFCLAAARPGVSAGRLWLEIGALAGLAAAAAGLLLGRPSQAAVAATSASLAGRGERCSGLLICYGVLGFGYIVPATFLTAVASEVVDGPWIFGLAWPAFGFAAALSAIVAVRRFSSASGLRIWAGGHVIMAAGVVLPSLWLSSVTTAIAALLVGSTFMVVTMLGIQEARARAPDDPTGLLGLMTAAFAIGQLGGPVVSGILELLPGGPGAALDRALQLAAAGLALSAVYLWRRARAVGGHM